MLAAFYRQQGDACKVLETGEVPTPEPGPGEVRVHMRTSGVNPSDTKSRRGGPGRSMSAPLIIPHSDGAGDIDAVGAGVCGRIGERVWIWNGQWKRAHGTAAQYIVVPSGQAIRLREDVPYEAGACFGIPALTAIQAVRLAEIGPGKTVLIAGGAGAVAHYAIQIAKIRGAQVIATVSSDLKAAHARAAGANETINYRTEDVAKRVHLLTCARGVDALIEMDLSANVKLYPGVLRPHSTVVVYGTSPSEAALPGHWLLFNSITLRFFLVYELSAADRAAGIDELTELLECRRLIHTVTRRLPLEEIAEGHEIVECGEIIGNLVVDIP